MNTIAWFLGVLTAKLLDPVSIITVFVVCYFSKTKSVLIYAPLAGFVITTLALVSSGANISLSTSVVTFAACFLWSLLFFLVGKAFQKKAQ